MKLRHIGLAAALLLSFGMVQPSSVAASEIVIRYSNWLPPGFWLWDDILEPWTREIADVTEGRVRVEVAPKVVGSAAAQYDVVRDGLADMSWITAGYTPGRFPIMEFGDLGQIHPKAEVLAPVFDRIYRSELEKHNIFAGIEPLSLPLISPLQIVTRNNEITAPEQLAGAKLRSSSITLTAVLESLGAVPILKSAAEAYEMLASGQIDGQVTNLNTITGFNQIDLLDGVFHVPGGLANSFIIIGINSDTWAKISPADQEAIRAISEEVLAGKVGAAYDAADARALEDMAAAGYVIHTATPEQIAQMRERIRPVEEMWMERARAAGLENPEAILERFRAETAAADQ